MEIGEASNTNFLAYVQMFEQLFSAVQMLCGQTHGVADRLCQEVARATQGHAQLLLRRLEPAEKESIPSSLPFVSFPVQFREHIYGTLDVVLTPDSDATPLTSPILPLPVAHLLAHICGWLLYILELAAFLQKQPQQPDFVVSTFLTKREQEVLLLICRGLDQEAIAEALSITSATVKKHRQHLYRQLGVHSEQALFLAAYRMGLFSPLAELF